MIITIQFIRNGNIDIWSMNNAYNRVGVFNDGGTVKLHGAGIYGDADKPMDYGVYNNSGTVEIENVTISYNNIGIFNNGTLILSGENIIANKEYDIYHNSKDENNDGLIVKQNTIINSKIYLAQKNNYISVHDALPQFSNIEVSQKFSNRKIIKTESQNNSNQMESKINVTNKEKYKYFTKNEGENWYVVLNDKKNGVIVSYNDSISSIESAQYWYNNSKKEFLGEGIKFESGTHFENYGFYKIIVTNNSGLKREIEITLNNDSI